jgi:glycosyltransferase involved in cell wall biosynthesis
VNPSATPLRILFHHRVAASDGMRVHIGELVGALREAGHVVLIVGPRPGGGPEAQAGLSSRLERTAERLRRLLPAAVYELLELAYNLPAYLRLRAAVNAFGPDVIYERYNLFLLAGLLFARRARLPMLLEINSPLASERAEHGGLGLKPVARWCESALWRGSDAALPVTHVLAAEVRRTRAEGAVHVVPNGANPGRRPSDAAVEAVRRRLGLGTGTLVLGFAGFVRPWHGVEWAVDALTRLPPRAHLVIVGDGPALPQLEARAEALGVSNRLRLVGRAPHEEAPAYVRTFDIALQPAAVRYASPLKLFEYMDLGCAIVAPDQPNIREVLTDGKDALLFPPGDREAFWAALERLCLDETLRTSLGAGARRTVEETPYTWAHNAERIGAIASALLRLREASARP